MIADLGRRVTSSPMRSRRTRRRAAVALLTLFGAACAAAPDVDEPVAVGPVTVEVDRAVYAAIRHVSAEQGSDAEGDGSADRPWATIGHALADIIDAGPAKRYAILVAEGTYHGPTLELRPYVDLFGGFEPGSWQRDIVRYPSVLDGEGERRIAVGADHTMIDGFVLRRGSVRGKGGAILADGVSPTITNNVFVENTTLGPEGWAPPIWHETAHDGGAIACLNGCSALVERNLFVRNTTQIGRGAGFACDNEATRDQPAEPRVLRNVFVANTASAGEDPARSGDGGAVSYYGYCDGEIVGNIVADNEAAKRNDGGGIFIALWSAPLVAENVIVGNRSGDDAGGLFLGGQKHHYGTPKDPVPPAEAFFVRIERNVLMGNRNGAPTSGAFRATMMSRGEFVGNVAAENPGAVYTQRSELTLARNTFVADARHEDEERTAPGPTIWRDNIITGERNWNAPVTDEGTCREAEFVDDGFTLAGVSATYDHARYLTRVEADGLDALAGSLVGRVVQAGERWSVVRANAPGVLEVWGDFGGQTGFEVKPTYTVVPGSACEGRGARAAVVAEVGS